MASPGFLLSQAGGSSSTGSDAVTGRGATAREVGGKGLWRAAQSGYVAGGEELQRATARGHAWGGAAADWPVVGRALRFADKTSPPVRGYRRPNLGGPAGVEKKIWPHKCWSRPRNQASPAGDALRLAPARELLLSIPSPSAVGFVTSHDGDMAGMLHAIRPRPGVHLIPLPLCS